jgi:hypothetical protein
MGQNDEQPKDNKPVNKKRRDFLKGSGIDPQELADRFDACIE